MIQATTMPAGDRSGLPRRRCRALAALLAVLALPAPATTGQLDGTLKVSGRTVEVQVRHKDGRAATGVPLRLLDEWRLTVAAARTDEQGRWVCTVRRSGAYQLDIEMGPGADETIRLPCTVLDVAAADETDNVPWLTASLGLGCIVGAAVLFVAFRSRRSRRSGAHGLLPQLPSPLAEDGKELMKGVR